jgi:hypothetical protein
MDIYLWRFYARNSDREKEKETERKKMKEIATTINSFGKCPIRLPLYLSLSLFHSLTHSLYSVVNEYEVEKGGQKMLSGQLNI